MVLRLREVNERIDVWDFTEPDWTPGDVMGDVEAARIPIAKPTVEALIDEARGVYTWNERACVQQAVQNDAVPVLPPAKEAAWVLGPVPCASCRICVDHYLLSERSP